MYTHLNPSMQVLIYIFVVEKTMLVSFAVYADFAQLFGFSVWIDHI